MQQLSSRFICASERFCTVENFVNAPYIRKTFELKDFKTAKIYVCGLGFYRIFINGKDITKGLLCPYISNPDQIMYYDCYDLKNELKSGKNTIGFILGNGMQNCMGGNSWDMDVAEFRGSPKVAFSLYLDDTLFMEADESFKWAKSPILFDDLRLGEYYDANLKIDGWAETCFNDSSWENCMIAKTPKGERKVSDVAPIKKYKELKPVRIFNSENGYIYDFGYNSAGLYKLKIKGEKGQKITMRFGEVIKDNKLNLDNVCNANSLMGFIHKDIYYCNGNGVEEYEPSFTYHGFQYIYVEGITKEQATDDLLTFNFYTSELEELTEFACSDEIVNKLQAMCKNATRSNFYHFPTDCPQREKNGWTGDVAVSVEQMLLNFDSGINFREWMNSVRCAQREDGALPGIIPTAGWGFSWGNGPAWDSVISLVPYYVYKYTGDKKILEENADAIYKYLKYMRTKISGKVLCYGLGDWCEVMATRPSTPEYFTDTAICYNICKKAEFIFELLSKKEELQYTKELLNEILGFLRKGFLTKKGLCIIETQTAYAMLVEYDVLTEEEKPRAVQRIAELIAHNNYKMRAGILGARLIFHALSKYGYNDLALKVITDTDYPSYGEWVKKGQTSLWERFQETEDRIDGELWQVNGAKLDSLNHHMFSDITQWFMKNIAGINVNPEMKNHKHIVIKPEKFEKINECSGSYKRENNAVKVSWKKADGIIDLIVEKTGDFIIDYDLKNFNVLGKETTNNIDKFKLSIK